MKIKSLIVYLKFKIKNFCFNNNLNLLNYQLLKIKKNCFKNLCSDFIENHLND